MSIFISLVALLLSLVSPAWAITQVPQFGSGAPAAVCQPNDTMTGCQGVAAPAYWSLSGSNLAPSNVNNIIQLGDSIGDSGVLNMYGGSANPYIFNMISNDGTQVDMSWEGPATTGTGFDWMFGADAAQINDDNFFIWDLRTNYPAMYVEGNTTGRPITFFGIDPNVAWPPATTTNSLVNIGQTGYFNPVGQQFGLLLGSDPSDTSLYQNQVQMDAGWSGAATGFGLSNSGADIGSAWYEDFVQIRVNGATYGYGSSYPSLYSSSNAAGEITLNVQGSNVKEFAIGSYDGVPTSFYHGSFLDASLGYNGYALTVNPLSNGGESGLLVNGQTSIVDGTQSNGYVFTSDSFGNGSWQAPPPASSLPLSGLTNPTADTSIDLNTYNMTTSNVTQVVVSGIANVTTTGITSVAYSGGVTFTSDGPITASTITASNCSAHSGQASCWATGGAAGYCTSVVGLGGACTCAAC